MKRLTLTLVSLFSCLLLYGQVPLAPKKTLQAQRILEKITLDANLSEAAWVGAVPADDFLVMWPNPGSKASLQTTVKLLYDNDALYVGAYCRDVHPDSIFHRLSKRDELENTDAFSIVLDMYRDGQNALQFGVTPDNIQFDSKYSLANANPDNGDADGEDSSWDAVWRSSARIVEDGWIIEMEIPYAALRFPKTEVQEWNANFYRNVRRRNETHSWNEVKAEINGTLRQMGHLDGINNIKAPLRLSATPFVAGYANNVYNLPSEPHSGWAYPTSFGMDVKYGINEAFTLDATVIPDFGQVRTDNFVLNLSPFEVRFNENRPFFTEGTELFNKGNLFYSRRVGGGGARLLNAAKISGRTQHGLGIGFFNAVEAEKTETETVEGIETETTVLPLTNKSILVFDQNLRNNSSVTFINTNVMRSGQWTDANVTGITFNLKNKAQNYALSGKAVMSNRFHPDERESGFTANADITKISGNWQWSTSMNIESDRYNPNDLGLLFSPNEVSSVSWVNYSYYKPWWKLNNYWSSIWHYSGFLYKPFGNWTETGFGFNFGGNTRSFHNFGINAAVNPWGEHDYFEPRTLDFVHYYRLPASGRINFWYNSDNRKKLIGYANGGLRRVDEAGRKNRFLYAGTRWRASGKLTVGIGFGYEIQQRNVGGLWSSEIRSDAIGFTSSDEILLGRRDIRGFNNDLNANYAFNNRMNLSLYSRHYWQRAEYGEFYTLDAGGNLAPTSYTGKTAEGESVHDVAANYFNIDLVFTWRFAPGSDILVVYKNFIGNNDFGYASDHNYWYNAGHLFNWSGSNSFSFKILYFLDYARVKKMF